MNEPLSSDEESPNDPERRQFLSKAVSFVFGGVVVAVPVGAGLATLLSPLGIKNSEKLKVRLASLDDLPADGTPKLFQVVAERKDAWTKYPNKPIGSVFLRRKSENEVVAFNSSCPHAGCSVDLSKSVSPRGLDELEVDKELLKQGQVWITFVNFKAGVTEKIEV